MFPVFQFVIALFLAEYLVGVPARYIPICDGLWTPVGTVLAVLSIGPVGAWLYRRLDRELRRARGNPARWEATVLGHYRTQSLFRGAPISVYVVVCLILGWPSLVARSPLGGTILIEELVAVLPFLFAQALTWIAQFRMERLLTGRAMRLGPYLRFQSRMILLSLAPILALVAVFEFVESSYRAQLYVWAFPFLVPLMVLLMLVLIYVLGGLLMRAVFPTRTMEPGPIRTRLEAFARRVDFRCRDLLVWNTGLNLINAAIVGGARRFRYVLFTEGMLESFNEAEIEAVLAHEVGHAKGHHIDLYVVFTVTVLFLYQIVFEVLESHVPEVFEWPHSNLVVFVILIVVCWRALFGVVSRTFEREADLFAAIAVGDHRRFTHALEEVAGKSGTLRTIPSWRHFSIAQRVAFLEQAFTDVDVLEAFRRSVRTVKVALVVGALASGAYVLRNVGTEVKRGAILISVIDSVEAGDLRGAERTIQRSLGDPHVAGEVEEGLTYFGSREEGRAVGPVLLRAILERSRSRLTAGDFEGAVRLFKKALERRVLWGDETGLEVNRLRRRLRRERDAEKEP